MVDYIGDDVCDDGLVEGKEKNTGEDGGHCKMLLTRLFGSSILLACQSPSPSAYGTWWVYYVNYHGIGGKSFDVKKLGFEFVASGDIWPVGANGLHCRRTSVSHALHG